jgi:glutathione S-transferase
LREGRDESAVRARADERSRVTPPRRRAAAHAMVLASPPRKGELIMNDIILHHYPPSPFAEKVRVTLGIKGMSWKSVLIPLVMPKPELMPLTGGYRRTPVMQIGADIYCDTQIIVRELERRFPEPKLAPAGSEALAEALAFWADRILFGPAVSVALDRIGEMLPEAFFTDRAGFFGRPFERSAGKQDLLAATGLLYAGLSQVEAMLADGRAFLLGAAPSSFDAAVYNPVWFLRSAGGAKVTPLDRLPRISAWADRMAAFGSGSMSELSASEALDIARRAQPEAPTSVDAADPSGLQAGARVSVMPDDTGKVPVTGELVGLDAHEIAIRRVDENVGVVVVHFPRAGFLLSTES